MIKTHLGILLRLIVWDNSKPQLVFLQIQLELHSGRSGSFFSFIFFSCSQPNVSDIVQFIWDKNAFKTLPV